MKLKVYILKKRQLVLAISFVVFILLLSLVLIFTFKSKETIKNVSPVQTVHADIDGDKKIDTIYISTNSNNSYSVDVKTKKGDGFSLKPDPLLKTLGYNNKSWPMYIDCKDINGDKSQEIIIQSSDEKGPLLHVYSYIKGDNKLEKLISGRYNIFGSSTEKSTPIIMLGSSDTKLDFVYYSIENNTLKPYTGLSFGKQTLVSLASFISQDNLEAANTSPSLLTSIEKGDFLDANLINVKYKNDIPSECTYQIRTNSYGENSSTNLYKVKINATSYKNNTIQYDIKDIKPIN